MNVQFSSTPNKIPLKWKDWYQIKLAHILIDNDNTIICVCLPSKVQYQHDQTNEKP